MTYFDEYATEEVNKSAYKKLSLRWHPDRPMGNENVMKDINKQWSEAKQMYASGAWPRMKQPSAPTGGGYKHYNVFGGGVHEAPKAPEKVYNVTYRKKKYKGTETQVYIEILTELGPGAAVDFLMQFNKLKANQAMQDGLITDLFKNLFK